MYSMITRQTHVWSASLLSCQCKCEPLLTSLKVKYKRIVVSRWKALIMKGLNPHKQGSDMSLST